MTYELLLKNDNNNDNNNINNNDSASEGFSFYKSDDFLDIRVTPKKTPWINKMTFIELKQI